MSKFVKVFKDLPESLRNSYELKRNFILVEKLNTEAKTKSGIIISTAQDQFGAVKDDLPDWARVLEVGEGYDDAEGNPDSTLLEVQPGNIVLIPKLSINYFSYFGSASGDSKANSVGISTSDSAQMVFKDEESFNEFFKFVDNVENDG